MKSVHLLDTRGLTALSPKIRFLSLTWTKPWQQVTRIFQLPGLPNRFEKH